MRLLNIQELRTVKGVDFSKPQIYRLIADKKFPRQLSISEKRVAWLESEIDAWIQERAEARAAA